MYKIDLITDRDGEERLDGRYPFRKNCIVKNIMCCGIDNVIFFEYYKDANGNEKQGTLRTSAMKDVRFDGNRIIIITLNSVYYLTPVKD